MAGDFIIDIFVVGFIVLTLGFITIKSWLLVLQTISTQRAIKSGKQSSPSKIVIEYIIFALGVTLITVGVLYIIHNKTNINLQREKVNIPTEF